MATQNTKPKKAGPDFKLKPIKPVGDRIVEARSRALRARIRALRA